MSGVVVKNMSFKAGQTLKVSGVAKPEAADFAINIGRGEDDFALHLNPRFDAHGDQHTVVCNSYEGGSWCDEQRTDSFPFQQGGHFEILVTFNNQEFQVSLPDGCVINFPNRLGDDKYNYFNFIGDIKIQSLEIK